MNTARMLGDSRRYWCLVSSRFNMAGLRLDVQADARLQWTVSPELRSGDMVVMYERGRASGPDGLPGRKAFTVVARAESDAESDGHGDHWAHLTAIALQPGVAWSVAKADPVVGRWSAVRARMQGRRGNHEVPADVWHALVHLADQADPGVGADIRALASGRGAPARGPGRAPVAGEDLGEFETECFQNETEIEEDFFAILAEGSNACPATPADGVTPKGGNGHAIPGHASFCDAMVMANRRLVVVEFETAATGDPAHGVLQAVRYRREWESAGVEVSACVVAQTFAEVELALAKEHGVECFRLIVRPDADIVELANLHTADGPLGHALTLDHVAEIMVGEYDLTDPAIVEQFGGPSIDGALMMDPYMQFLSILLANGWDIEPMRHRITSEEFDEQYLGQAVRAIVADFGLARTVHEEQLEALTAAFGSWAVALSSGGAADARSFWPQEGAPYFLVDPAVARQLGAPLADDGFAAPRLYWHTLLMIQDAGYDLSPLIGRMDEGRFAREYSDWCTQFRDDFGL